MLERLKSLPLTIILTILIWMYAEAQFTATQDGVMVALKVAAPTPNLSVRLFDPTDNRFHNTVPVRITIQGARGQVERLYQQSLGVVAPDDEFSNLVYRARAGELPLGTEGSLDTLAMLNSVPYFKNRGIIVTAASPPRLRLDVEQIAKLSRPVLFRSAAAPGAEVLSITPDRADVAVPDSVLRAIAADPRAAEEKVAVIAAPVRDLSTLPPDVPQTIQARLTVEYPGAKDERVTVTPQTVSVTLRLPRPHEDVLVVPDVPVWVSGPPTILGRRTVKITPSKVQVKVAGSAAALGALRDALARPGTSTGVRAYLDVTPEDEQAKGVQTRAIRYVLPEGVELREGPREVEFEVGAVPATGPTPGSGGPGSGGPGTGG